MRILSAHIQFIYKTYKKTDVFIQEVVPNTFLGKLIIRLKATLSNQSMDQHGAVVPTSRLDARAVKGCIFFTSLSQSDATHLTAWLPSG